MNSNRTENGDEKPVKSHLKAKEPVKSISMKITMREEEWASVLRGWNPEKQAKVAFIRGILLNRKVRYFYVNESWDALLEEMLELKSEWRTVVDLLREAAPGTESTITAKQAKSDKLVLLLVRLQENQKKIIELIHKIGNQWLRQYGSLPAHEKR